MPLPLDPMWVLILGGLFLLSFGAEFLVRAAVAVANRLGVSSLLIGLTLVGFGTSTPELVTSIQAALVHSPGIALGNITGSNIANILLIVGLAAIITPVVTSFGAVWRDSTVMLLTAVLLAWVSVNQVLTVSMGWTFLGLLALYVLIAWAMERQKVDVAPLQNGEMGLVPGIVVAIISLGVLIMGARMFVDGSIILARDFGLSETFIGLTLVAVGTSLPELFTSVVAAVRRQGDISIGNIIGSNIYNILGVGGVTAIIHPIEVPSQIAGFDNFVMIGASVLLLLSLLVFRGVGKAMGLFFVALYGAYIWFIHPSQSVMLAQATDWIASTGIIERLRGLGL